MEKERILLIDNDPVSGLETKKELLSFGYEEILIAATVGEAVDIASGIQLDIALVAVASIDKSKLPNSVKIIKEQFDIPIIYITSQTDDEDLKLMIKQQPNGILNRPIDNKVLRTTMLMSQSSVNRDSAPTLPENNTEESDQHYKELVETVNSIIMKFDPRGDILFINNYGQEFFGFEEDELVGRNIVGSILPEVESTGRDLLAMIKAILKSPNNRLSNENENICKDGRRVWISWTNSGIFDEQGNLTELLCTGHDITERKKLEKEIEKHSALALANQKRFQAIFDNTYDGIAVVNAETAEIMMSNQAFCCIFDYSQEELHGLSMLELHHKEDQDAAANLFFKHARGEISFTESFPGRRKNGSRIYVEINTSLLKLDSQDLVIGIFRDITEAKLQEKGFSLAQEFSKTGQWKFDHIKGQVEWSEGVYNILESKPEHTQPSYQVYLDSIHPEDRNRIHAAFQYSLDAKIPYETYAKLLMSDGRVKYIKESCYTEFDAQGNALHSIGIIVDITELKSYQESIEWQLKVNRILTECMEYNIEKERSLHEMSSKMMDKSLELTQSKHGFVASVAKETGAMVGHTITNPIPGSTQCELNEEHRHAVFYPQENGRFVELFGQSANTGKPFLTNSVVTHPEHRGLPKGHIPIKNFLSVPVIVDGRVSCVIAVANSRTPYTNQESGALEQLAEMFALSIQTIEAREASQKSKTRFKGLVESSADWIWETNKTGKFTYSSPRVNDILGLKPEEIIGRHLSELLPYKADDRIESIYDLLTSSEALVENINHSKNHQNGDLVYLETNATPVFGSHKELIGYRGVSRDVTKRKQVELELNSQQIMLQSILDSIQEAAFLITPEGEVLFANQTLTKRMNHEDKQIVGTNILDQLSPDLAKSRKAVGDSVLKTGKRQTFEDSSDGRFFENMVYPFFDSKTDKKGLAILSIDITERRIKDQELRMLRRGIEQAPVSIVITDEKGDIEYVNPYFCNMTGYSETEAVGENPRILKSGLHEPVFYERLWETISGGKTWTDEMCSKNKNGDFYWEQVSISPVTNRVGEITHYIGVKEDITLKKHMEQVKEDMDRILRHDLRTPLNAMLGYPQLLLKSDNLTEKQKRYVKNIKKSGKSMLDMIDLYLNLVKIESGQYVINPETYCILETINGIFDDLQPLVTQKEIQLSLSSHQIDNVRDESIWCTGEQQLTQSALSNLIGNAIEASPANKTVKVYIEPRDTDVIIRIENRGAVPKDMRERFFQKYATSGKSKGTGLGTYSAKLLIDVQSGGINVETFDEDDVTCITVQLPLDRKQN